MDRTYKDCKLQLLLIKKMINLSSIHLRLKPQNVFTYIYGDWPGELGVYSNWALTYAVLVVDG